MGDKRDKDGGLICIPEYFMMEMIQRDWILLDKVVWAKIVDLDDGTTIGNCMTEPASHRLNSNGYEFLFRFAKNKNAWADTCAIAIPRQEKKSRGRPKKIRYLPSELMTIETSIEGRNLHNVWRTTMGQTRKKHFAVYPTTLCERPVAMTCPMKVCGTCGHLQERIIEKVEYNEGRTSKRVFGKYQSVNDNVDPKEIERIKKSSGRMDFAKQYVPRKPVTRGWTKCGHRNWQPGVVLDPFVGSGTTGEVALKMGRNFFGVDIYPEFLEMTRERCEKTVKYLTENFIDPWKLIR